MTGKLPIAANTPPLPTVAVSRKRSSWILL